MIIRSGLIRNRDGVDFGEFTHHWRTVHAPLVVPIDGLRAYSQNHVLERLTDGQTSTLHRVDGISQLYFDDVEAMKVAMSSPEQEACIVDLRGFLSEVTLLIQEAGEIKEFTSEASGTHKQLYLLHCDRTVLDRALEGVELLMSVRGEGWKYRLNPIIARDVVVDQSIEAGEQVVDFVLEVWNASPSAGELITRKIASITEIEVIAGFSVDEFVVIPQR